MIAALVGFPDPARTEDGARLPLFADQQPLELRISAPMRWLSQDTADDRTWRRGRLSILGPASVEGEFDVELRVRGRNRLEQCDFPPLSIDFSSKFAGSVFEGQSRLKLVTLCKTPQSYRDYLALEFQIYRMLNVLTDLSFRVRWAEVEYVESEKRARSSIRPAFFIEAIEEVAERNRLVTVKQESVAPEALDPDHAALTAVFQFLIGNTDWSMLAGPDDKCCHNGKLLIDDDRLIVTSYDFDQAGLINAEYAVPSDRIPISRVTRRYYRGFCRLNGNLADAISLINSRLDTLYHGFDAAPASDRARERALEFFEESIEMINDPSRFEAELIGRCRP